jgi:hypothetical protein
MKGRAKADDYGPHRGMVYGAHLLDLLPIATQGTGRVSGITWQRMRSRYDAHVTHSLEWTPSFSSRALTISC